MAVHTQFKDLRFSYHFVFEPFALDVELHSGGTGTRAGTWATRAEVAATSSTVDAAAVLCPADLTDSDTAKASTSQG